MHGHLIIQDLAGDWIVYPGHPLVLATVIMKTLADFDAANRPSGLGWCEALADSRIPGAGDHVGAAMSVLRVGAAGGSIDDMVVEARRYWTSGRAGGHVNNVDAGTAQADAIEPHFRANAVTWFAY
jgi:hypothetical protein